MSQIKQLLVGSSSLAAAVLFGTVVVAQDVTITIGEVEDQCANQCTLGVTWFMHAVGASEDEVANMWELCQQACEDMAN